MAPAKKKKAPTKAAAGKTEASQQADEEENVETVDTRATSVMQLAEDHCIKIDQDGRKETLHLLPLHLCRNWTFAKKRATTQEVGATLFELLASVSALLSLVPSLPLMCSLFNALFWFVSGSQPARQRHQKGRAHRPGRRAFGSAHFDDNPKVC